MERWIARALPILLIAWLAIGVLVPRQSALRPLYLLNTYALLPLALLLVFILHFAVRGERLKARLQPPELGVVLFAGVALASIVLAGEPRATAVERLLLLQRAFIVPFAAFWLVRISRPDEARVAAWVPILAGLCLLEAGVGTLVLFRSAVLPAFWPGFVRETGGLRLTGTLTQADSFAAVAVFAASICFFFLASAPGLASRLLGVALIVVGFSAAFASFSRASWIGGVAALAILWVVYRARIVVPALGIALAVAGISRIPAGMAREPGSAAGGAPGVAPRDAGSYAMERLGNSGTLSDRVVLDAAGLRMFLEKPLVGWGFGSVERRARGFVGQVGPFGPSEWAKHEAASHNSVVAVLAELGVVGFACLAFPVAWIAAQTAKALRRGRQDALLVTIWANLAFLAVVSMSIDLRYLACASGLAWLLLGLASVRAEEDGRSC